VTSATGQRSTLEPGARVAPGSWSDLELDIASVFFGRGRKRPEEAGEIPARAGLSFRLDALFTWMRSPGANGIQPTF